MVERSLSMREVLGSIPRYSSVLLFKSHKSLAFPMRSELRTIHMDNLPPNRIYSRGVQLKKPGSTITSIKLTNALSAMTVMHVRGTVKTRRCRTSIKVTMDCARNTKLISLIASSLSLSRSLVPFRVQEHYANDCRLEHSR